MSNTQTQQLNMMAPQMINEDGLSQADHQRMMQQL